MEKRPQGNMEGLRKPFQGIANVIRFNWHFYLLAGAGLMALWFVLPYFSTPFYEIGIIGGILACMSVIVSVMVTYYIYDLSPLYSFNWLDDNLLHPTSVVNIHAGFDETSGIIAHKFPEATLTVFDFYDPKKHTEISIKRARKAYPPYPGSMAVNTAQIPCADASQDLIFLVLSAHEIRNETERIQFFKELKRALKPEGKIIVVEHLRDHNNFFAYTLGFFHFLSKKTWKRTFEKAGLNLFSENKITLFLSVFTLQ